MRFEDINLARLPPPVIPAPTYEAIRSSRLADLTERLNMAGIAFDATKLETDPLVIVEEAGAYREMLAYSRRDDAVKAVMLATAWGIFLDHLGVFPFGITRNVVTPATVTTAAVYETDNDFRARIQLAPEAFSTCGPEGAYLYFALATDGVKNASVYARSSTFFDGVTEAPVLAPVGHPTNVGAAPSLIGRGEVHVPILSTIGDGAASDALVLAVSGELSAKTRRPIADFLIVTSALVQRYEIIMRIFVGRGVDTEIVRVEAEARANAYTLRQHRVGASVLRSGIFAAGHVPDDEGAALVEDVIITSPARDIHPGPYGAAFCTAITITIQAING